MSGHHPAGDDRGVRRTFRRDNPGRSRGQGGPELGREVATNHSQPHKTTPNGNSTFANSPSCTAARLAGKARIKSGSILSWIWRRLPVDRGGRQAVRFPARPPPRSKFALGNGTPPHCLSAWSSGRARRNHGPPGQSWRKPNLLSIRNGLWVLLDAHAVTTVSRRIFHPIGPKRSPSRRLWWR